MKQRTEIILLTGKDEDLLIEQVDGLLNLQVNDKFYFSFKGTSPLSEAKYRDGNNTSSEIKFPNHIIEGVIDEINTKSKEYWTKHYQVVKITKSYEKDHMISISDPRIVYTESIFVTEVE